MAMILKLRARLNTGLGLYWLTARHGPTRSGHRARHGDMAVSVCRGEAGLRPPLRSAPDGPIESGHDEDRGYPMGQPLGLLVLPALLTLSIASSTVCRADTQGRRGDGGCIRPRRDSAGGRGGRRVEAAQGIVRQSIGWSATGAGVVENEASTHRRLNRHGAPVPLRQPQKPGHRGDLVVRHRRAPLDMAAQRLGGP